MNIDTVTQNYNANHEVGKVIIDDTIDLVIVKLNGEYTIKVIKNNCFNVNIKEIELNEVNYPSPKGKGYLLFSII